MIQRNAHIVQCRREVHEDGTPDAAKRCVTEAGGSEDSSLSGRFEWRVFSSRQDDDVSAAFEALPGTRSRDAREDVYLLGPAGNGMSVKVRGEEYLEAKMHIGSFEGFERWKPAWRIALPVELETVRSALGEYEMKDIPALRNCSLDAGLLIEATAFAHEDVRWARVRKTRVSVKLPAGEIAETVQVDSDAWSGFSMAVEGENLDRTMQLRDRLGLGAWRNRSYPDFLFDPENRSGGSVT